MKRRESNLRKEDVSLSNKIYDFLDMTFYKNEVTEFERVYDKPRQLKGEDVIFTIGDKKYIADEKAAVRYRNLKTYSLELSFINRNNEVQDGWFINDKLENNSYVFVWIDNEFGKETVTVAIVMKDKIFDYLKTLGWSKENLIKKMKQIRNGEQTSFGNIYENGCKFSYSTKLVEQPINILLPRNKYEELADKIWKEDLKIY